jgi:PDZ domain
MADDIAERRRIFRTLVPYFGTVQPASFFRDTSAVVKGVKRIHPLIEGIYKPAGSIYALSIASMLKSRYGDRLFHNPDRGIRDGDFIVAFNGVSVESSDDLFKMLTEEKIGIFQDVTVIRHDKKIDLRVTPVEARMRA